MAVALPFSAGSTVIVTGAGSGIGRATAVRLARHGASVVLVGRSSSTLEGTVSLCEEAYAAAGSGDDEGQAGRCALVVEGDIVEPATREQAVSTAVAHGRALVGLVNNAGLARFAPLEAISDHEARTMIDVNLLGPLQLTALAVPHLRAVKGSVVNVTSVGGLVAMPGRSAYGCTKAALNHLTRSLAVELAPHVRVNAVAPGPVATAIYGDLGVSQAETSQLKQRLLMHTPCGRFGEPEEVARWICHLLSPGSSWVTGAIIPVDGGRSAAA